VVFIWSVEVWRFLFLQYKCGLFCLVNIYYTKDKIIWYNSFTQNELQCMIRKSLTIPKGQSEELKKDRQDNGQWKKDKDLENKKIIQHYVQDRITPVIV